MLSPPTRRPSVGDLPRKRGGWEEAGSGLFTSSLVGEVGTAPPFRVGGKHCTTSNAGVASGVSSIGRAAGPGGSTRVSGRRRTGPAGRNVPVVRTAVGNDFPKPPHRTLPRR